MFADQMEPPEFAQVVIGSRAEQACTPKPPSMSWRGVAIAAPRVVRGIPDDSFVVPVCGHFMLPAEAEQSQLTGTLHLKVEGEPPIRPQAIGLEKPDNETGITPGPAVPPQSLARMAMGGYFSFDLGHYLAPPKKPTWISLVLEVRGVASAPVSFQWIPTPVARRQWKQ
jgi:hypothetical protein